MDFFKKDEYKIFYEFFELEKLVQLVDLFVNEKIEKT